MCTLLFFLLLYNEHKYFQRKLQLEINHVFTFIHSAVTSENMAALKMKVVCPVSWCARRFTTKTELRGHELSHKQTRVDVMDQMRLATGAIQGQSENADTRD